jgi:hypothetical protein
MLVPILKKSVSVVLSFKSNLYSKRDEKGGKAEKSATQSADFSFYDESDFDHSPVFNNVVVFYLCIATLHVN